MVKILICGDVNGNWDTVFSRLAALQKSAHGPFDCMFCTGKTFAGEEEYNAVISSNEFIIPTYITSTTGILSAECIKTFPKNLEILVPNKLLTIQTLTVAVFSKATMTQSSMIAVRAIASSGAYRGCDLLLSDSWPYDSHQFLNEVDMKMRTDTGIPLGEGSSDVSDFVMLTRPRYHFATGYSNFYQRSPFAFPSSSAGGNSNNNTSISSRFISLAVVSKSKDKSHKWLHALSLAPITHMTATELQQDANGCGECPYIKVGGVIPPPSNKRNAAGPFSSSSSDGGNDAKKFRSNPPLPPNVPPVHMSINDSNSSSCPSSFFFNDASSGRSSINSNRKGSPAHLKTSSADPELVTPSTTIRSLFVGNLLNHSSAEDIIQAIFPQLEIKGSASNYAASINRVNTGAVYNDRSSAAVEFTEAVARFHRPDGKSFAFIDCLSHTDALGVIDLAKSKCINVDGRTLSIGWGKEKETSRAQQGGGAAAAGGNGNISSSAGSSYLHGDENRHHGAGGTRKHRVRSASKHANFVLNLNSPSPDATTLFVGNLPAAATATELVALFGSVLPSSSAGLSLTDVMLPAGRGYAFIEFRSSVDAEHVMDIVLAQQMRIDAVEAEHRASMVVTNATADGGESDNSATAAVTAVAGDTTDVRNSNDGDAALVQKVTALMSEYAFLLHHQVLSTGWAKGKSAHRMNPHSTHAQDCWFCLASPQVKAHMIISISEHCYVALARGGITDFHVLIVPIDCVPNRLHLSADSKRDLLAYDVALTSMFGTMSLHQGQGQGQRQGGTLPPPPPPLPPPGAPNAPVVPSSSAVVTAAAPSYLCIRFERAIRTKGKDHMQYQLVPIASQFLGFPDTALAPAPIPSSSPAAPAPAPVPVKLEDSPAMSVFFKCISNYGLDFFELQNTLDAGSAQPVAVDEVVLHMEGGPYQEYFYIELPVLQKDNSVYYRRFLYVDNGSSDTSFSSSSMETESIASTENSDGKKSSSKPAQFPMHLGNEIVAQIIKQPHRSNWKNCLLPEPIEIQLVEQLKYAFAPFDFANQ